MAEAAEIRRRKRVADRSVLGGVLAMAMAMAVSTFDLAPPLLTTLGAVAGFVLLMHGVHVGWLVFYERELDGPPS